MIILIDYLWLISEKSLKGCWLEKKYSIIAEGWDFRKNHRKNHQYISARKGGEELSFEPYSDEKWAMIKDANKPKLVPIEELNSVQSIKKPSDSILSLFEWRNIQRDYIKFDQYVNRSKDNFCVF